MKFIAQRLAVFALAMSIGLLAGAVARADVFADGFECADCVAFECPAPPAGFEEHRYSWQRAFGAQYPFPETFGDFYPVGSWTIDGLKYTPGTPMAGRYIVIEFDGHTDPLQLQWNSAKPLGPPVRYAPARFTTALYLTISTCPGDFRLVSPFQIDAPDPINDPTLVARCRSTNTSEAIMSYGPAARGRFCPIEPGQRGYINIVFGDPVAGLDAVVSGCTAQSGACEISVKNRPTL